MAENEKSRNSKENSGRFAGIPKNKGDALTLWIWTYDTQELITRSIVCSEYDRSNPNERIATSRGEDYPPSASKGAYLHLFAEVVDVMDRNLTQVDPMDIIGRLFFLPRDDDGLVHCITSMQ